jgi:hypothetical protein
MNLSFEETLIEVWRQALVTLVYNFPMVEWLFSWEVVSVVVALLVSSGLGVIALDDFKLAKLFFLLAAADAAGGVVMWGVGAKTENPTWQVVLIVFLAVGSIGALTVLAFRYVDNKKRAKEDKDSKQLLYEVRRQQEGRNILPVLPDAAPLTPSLVFVFGAPLGDNDSATWVMVLKHYGPRPAYNCDIIFYDDDRKNIEHEWLVKHPDWPFPPPGLVGESQKRISVTEAGPEGSAGSFMWNPLDPNSQHYTVTISCHDGVFTERWEVVRVDGILRSRITIEHGPQWIKNNPDREPVIFRYQDPEFVKTALATEMPEKKKGKLIHPGWKPKYRFEVPAAIIDPNGNIQVVGGIKLPDGSTLTDFGSWNILTNHYGDNPNSSKQP